MSILGALLALVFVLSFEWVQPKEIGVVSGQKYENPNQIGLMRNRVELKMKDMKNDPEYSSKDDVDDDQMLEGRSCTPKRGSKKGKVDDVDSDTETDIDAGNKTKKSSQTAKPAVKSGGFKRAISRTGSSIAKVFKKPQTPSTKRDCLGACAVSGLALILCATLISVVP